jgi:hypothetical protein
MKLENEVRKKIEAYAPRPVNGVSYIVGVEGRDMYSPEGIDLKAELDEVDRTPGGLNLFVAISKQPDGSEQALRVLRGDFGDTYIFQELKTKVKTLEVIARRD